MRVTTKMGAVVLSGALACGLTTVSGAIAPVANAKPTCEGQTALTSMAAPLHHLITPDGKTITIENKRNVQQFVYLSSCDAEKLAKLIGTLEKGDDVKKQVVEGIPDIKQFADPVVKGIRDKKVLTSQSLKDQSSDFSRGVILVIKSGTIASIAKQV